MVLSGLSIAVHALFFLGIAIAVAGLAPRVIHLAWLPIIAASVVTLLGPLFSLTEQQMEFSPLTHSWANSDEAVWPLLTFAIIGVALGGVGLLGAQRRNLL